MMYLKELLFMIGDSTMKRCLFSLFNPRISLNVDDGITGCRQKKATEIKHGGCCCMLVVLLFIWEHFFVSLETQFVFVW